MDLKENYVLRGCLILADHILRHTNYVLKIATMHLNLQPKNMCNLPPMIAIFAGIKMDPSIPMELIDLITALGIFFQIVVVVVQHAMYSKWRILTKNF